MRRRFTTVASWGVASVLAVAALLPSPAAALTGRQYYEGIEAYRSGDYATAYAKLLPFAERGIASVQHRIGLMTYLGAGVPADKPRAAQWYTKAAVQGAGEAQLRLGDMYLRGDGVERNLALAAWWLERAANQGYGNAQYNLAYMHITGVGRPKDYVKAYVWLTRAMARNEAAAADLRRQLAGAMSPAEVELAARLGRGVDPSHVGLGVLVNHAGYVLTALHLVDGCRSVTTLDGARPQVLTRVGYDIRDNLALMKLARPRSGATVPLPWEKALRGGQTVYHAGVQSNGPQAPRLTIGKGRVEGLAGPNGDPRFIRLAARTASDDSGGPVLDDRGRLIGISLGWQQVLALTGARGELPELNHFAVNAAIVGDFLDYYQVTHDRAKGGAATLDDAGAVERMRAVTVGFACRR
ncbi:MAG: tetratricopeptide repeat-containing serine protease family protein [Kiloniellales bacterium]